MKKSDLVAYAQTFVSFAISKIDYPIKEVILFGSAARGEATAESDIDLFISIQNEKDVKKIENEIKKIENKFYKSQQYEQWRLKGIKNPFAVKIGFLEKWALKRSLISDGVVLYGKYREIPQSQAFILISFEPIKNIAQRNRIIRAFFGRKEKKVNIKEGLIHDFKGKLLSPTVFIVPAQFADEFLNILKKEKIDFKLFEIWSDQI